MGSRKQVRLPKSNAQWVTSHSSLLPPPSRASYRTVTRKPNKWHVSHAHHPTKDAVLTACGQMIPRVALDTLTDVDRPFSAVGRSRLCKRCIP